MHGPRGRQDGQVACQVPGCTREVPDKASYKARKGVGGRYAAATMLGVMYLHALAPSRAGPGRAPPGHPRRGPDPAPSCAQKCKICPYHINIPEIVLNGRTVRCAAPAVRDPQPGQCRGPASGSPHAAPGRDRRRGPPPAPYRTRSCRLRAA